jgi:hypothetical protein
MKSLIESEKWKLIKELENKEFPEDTVQARWDRLTELAQLGRELGIHIVDPDKIIVWQRWAKLREMFEDGLWDGRSLSRSRK